MTELPGYLKHHVDLADFALRYPDKYPTHEANARDLVEGWNEYGGSLSYPKTEEFIQALAGLLRLRAEGVEITIIPDRCDNEPADPICHACKKCKEKFNTQE